MAEMSVEQRDAFLNEARIAVLTTIGRDGWPGAAAIWFEWDGQVARMFTHRDSVKVKRIRRDPRVCLTVAEPTGVPEAWVSIEGTASIESDGGYALAERLAYRYYSAEKAAQTLPGWRAMAESWVVVAVEPRRVRTLAPD